ncbi:MAG: hypothetical protein V1810_00540 [Candidatus Beckwithbacteria bacterium]
MRRSWIFWILIGIMIGLVSPVRAIELEECQNKPAEEKARCLSDLTAELEAKIKEARGQQQTLASTIAYLDNKINLTRAEIEKTENELKLLEEEIATLSVKIERLDTDLTSISKLLVSRIGAAYKRSLFNPIYMIFSTGGLSDFFERNKYLQSVQKNDRNILIELQNSKDEHEKQKLAKETKQQEAETLRQKLAAQKTALGGQRVSKQELLDLTKNNEAKYQSMMAAAKAEIAAIQSILAGFGQEIKVGGINEGERVATIISGSSACSTGTHLHFEIGNNGANVNPASYLKPQDVDWDACWLGECDTFSFSGSWSWPINGKPRITQAYGMTAYARSGAYGGGPHTGIDMVSEDLVVKTVKNGTLYRGSIGCGGGTLRYVKVEQENNIDTYYLHVNYY